MALYPTNFQGQDRLQPGARGGLDNTSMPGYRGQDHRLTRSNMELNTSAHDVANIKYALDGRLPVLFRYGWAYGYNQIVVTKGRIMAVDPIGIVVDFETKKPLNVLTLANGGSNVKVSGVEWIKEVDAAGVAIPHTDEDYKKDGTIRKSNKPIGIIMRNEYTRDDDAFNGIMPGAILTDCMVELPWFGNQVGALTNPWGSAYGDIKPGDLVKSDETGRFVKSVLNDDAWLNDPKCTLAVYEHERQQVIGQIYETNANLVPMGAAIYAQWALEDRMNFNEFNPRTWKDNNRSGEDTIAQSPYKSDNTYPGYPYDRGYMSNDLHMLGDGARRDNFDPRLELQYQMQNGIPGLTDGGNVISKDVDKEVAGFIRQQLTASDRVIFKTSVVNVVKGSMHVFVKQHSLDASNKELDAAVAIEITGAASEPFILDYKDELQGLFALKPSAALSSDYHVYVSYKKAGKAGVPTNLDWAGCKGTVKILLQK